MILVGLTGSIAAGKSLFASFLAERGAVVIDADRLGHEVMRPDGPAYNGVLEAFGPGILGAGGEIDRSRLGPIVFADPEARLRLEAVVHPALLRELERRVNAAAARGARVVVIDAALLFELGADSACDLTVAVIAPELLQIQRLRARGLSETAARDRLSAQLSGADKALRATLVVDNAGTAADLAAEAGRVWDDITARPDIPGRTFELKPGKDDRR